MRVLSYGKLHESVDTNEQSKYEMLIDCIIKEDYKQVEAIVLSGIDLNSKFVLNRRGTRVSILSAAISTRNEHLIKFLFDHKLDPNQEIEGIPAIFFAFGYANVTSGLKRMSTDMMELFLDHPKIKLKVTDGRGNPLIKYICRHACEIDNYDLVLKYAKKI